MVRFAKLFICACAIAALATSAAMAHQTSVPRRNAETIRVPAILAVSMQLGAPPAGVVDLKFQDLFKLPVGPKGLETTDKLRNLDGKRVRIVGYMVRQEAPSAGSFMLSPLPVSAGDEDESLADDIPASAVFVSLPNGKDVIVPALPGLVRIVGTLHLGAIEVPGIDRLAAVRIALDAAPERALLRVARAAARQPTGAR
ncbi:hypothetical protein [Dokdonella soli]|uniref:Uncharacterized protein n=1 Tax=Dokdonella soli TaxID=529810 RepID=A0ABP3TM80_9GAMM